MSAHLDRHAKGLLETPKGRTEIIKHLIAGRDKKPGAESPPVTAGVKNHSESSTSLI